MLDSVPKILEYETSESLPSHSSHTQSATPRRSLRTSNALLWMTHYVESVQKLFPCEKPLYSIDQYLGYDLLSAKYQSYISSFGAYIEPFILKKHARILGGLMQCRLRSVP